MICKQPYWYSRWHGAIMLVFESVFCNPHVPDVYVLPAYANPSYGSDCVHLTEQSGLR
jgi:hypothetical protein